MTDRFSQAAAEFTGRWILGAITLAGINQKQLSERTNLSRTYISDLINGRKGAVRLITMLRILEACNLRLIDLRVACPAGNTAETRLLTDGALFPAKNKVK